MSNKADAGSGLFASFNNADFRAFWAGNLFSLIGSWIQQTAQGWLVFRLTGSAKMLGLVGFMGQAPLIVFGLFAGVLADRWDRRRALLVTQVISMAQALLLAALTMSDFVRPWHVVVLALVLGAANTFDMPLRHSFLIELVGVGRVRNAIALNSMMFNVSRMIGPALAGVLLATVGEGICFLLNGLSFCGVVWVLARLRSKQQAHVQAHEEPVLKSLREGLLFVWHRPHMRNPVLLLTLSGLVVAPVLVLLPAVAVRLLSGGPESLGVLLSSLGVGALLAAGLLAAQLYDRLLVAIGRAGLLYGAALLLVAFSRNVYVSCAGVLLAGFGAIIMAVGTNTQLQSGISGRMRGRLASLYMLSYFGLAPLGSLLLGLIADKFGIENAILLSGLWALLAAVWFLKQMPEMEAAEK
ncbi:MAG TPA: MFS transporter [Elusimicrobiales bacterium]|nr:MFS transporter [Elusimicrobiales bacterium]